MSRLTREKMSGIFANSLRDYSQEGSRKFAKLGRFFQRTFCLRTKVIMSPYTLPFTELPGKF